MIDIDIITQGYDGYGNYWPEETLKRVAIRFTAWNDAEQKKEEPTAFPVRYFSVAGPPMGHLHALWYDVVTKCLRGTVDTTTAQHLPGGADPDEVLRIGSAGVAYEMVEVEPSDHGGRVIKNAHIRYIWVMPTQGGIRMGP
jgi:hypothetical protein